MNEVTITNSNYEKEVLGSDKTVLLFFWASWCSTCKKTFPVISRIADTHGSTVKVGTVDVDTEVELVSRFRIKSVPMVIVMKNGKVIYTSAGYRPQEQIEALLK